MNEHRYEHLQAILERLKLTRVSERLDQLAEEAAKESWTYVEFLDRVLDVEVSARVERDVTMKTRLARFPFVKTLDQFDLLGSIVNWVEKAEAPVSVIATGKAFPGRSRPLCAYLKHAHYKGQGDTEDAANFECR